MICEVSNQGVKVPGPGREQAREKYWTLLRNNGTTKVHVF